MYPVSADFHNLSIADAPTSRVRIYFIEANVDCTDDNDVQSNGMLLCMPGETDSNGRIEKGGVTINEFFNSDANVQIGATVSSQIGMTLINRDGALDGFNYGRCKVYIDVYDDTNSTWLTCPMGVYNIAIPKRRKVQLVSATGYDQMQQLDEIADSWWNGLDWSNGITLLQIIQSMAATLGIHLSANTSANIVNSGLSYTEIPFTSIEMTYRDILSYIAETTGTIARFDRNGALDLRWFSDAVLSTDTQTYAGGLVTFTATNRASISSLSVPFSPIQDLHGYSSPWPAGGGVNKLAPASIGKVSESGITVTLTATELNGYAATKAEVTGTAASWGWRLYQVGIRDIVQPSTAYRLTFIANAQYDIRWNLCSIASQHSLSGNKAFTCTSIGSGLYQYSCEFTTVAADNDGWNYTDQVILFYSTPAALSPVTITIINNFCLTLQSDPEGWFPCSNICPISGRTGVDAFVAPNASMWSKYKLYVDTGAASEIFPVGKQITDTWKNTNGTEISFPWDVVHYTSNGDAFLKWHYAAPEALQFDAPEAIYYFDGTEVAGTYHIPIGSSYGTGWVVGHSIQFTLTAAPDEGDQLFIDCGTNNANDPTDGRTWKVFAKGDTTAKQSGTTSNGTGGTSLGTIGNVKAHRTNGRLNAISRVVYGYARWSQSAMRQYYNSDEAEGAWWTPQNPWDRPPTQAASLRGFLNGFSEDFLNHLEETEVVTALNTQEGFAEATETTLDKIFLPSLEQMYINPQLAGVEGESWDYYKELAEEAGLSGKFQTGQTYPILITYNASNTSSAVYVFLRSCNRGGAGNEWLVATSGAAGDGSGAHNAIRGCPACKFKKSTPNGTQYNVDWTSAAGTVYGGTLDVVTGALTVDKKYFTKSGDVLLYGNWGRDNAPLYYFLIDTTIPIKAYADTQDDGYILSNYFSATTGTGPELMKNNEIRVRDNVPDRLYFRWDSAGSLADINAAFAENPLQIVAELAAPLTYQLTPTQVEALVGTNNVLSTGDSVSVTVSEPNLVEIQTDTVGNQCLSIDVGEYQVSQIDALSVKASQADVGVTIGSGGNAYTILDNPMLFGDEAAITTKATPIYNRLSAFRLFTPISMRCIMDWSIEAGDIITVTNESVTYDLPIFQQRLRWRGGYVVSDLFSNGEQERPTQSKEIRSSFRSKTQMHEFEVTLEQLRSYIQSVDGNYTLIQQTVDAITQTVANQNVTIQNILDPTGEIWTAITKNTSNLSSIEDSLNNEITERKSYIRFIPSEPAIVMGVDEDNEIKLKLVNNIIYFFNGADDSTDLSLAYAYFNSQEAFADRFVAGESVQIGTNDNAAHWLWKKLNNGDLVLELVG